MQKKRGRPTEQVPIEKAESLLAHIERGDHIVDWARQNKVGVTSIFRWREKDPVFADRFARAREAGLLSLDREIIEISDQMPPVDVNGKIDNGYVQWMKLRIETRQKSIDRLKPKEKEDKNKDESLTITFKRLPSARD